MAPSALVPEQEEQVQVIEPKDRSVRDYRSKEELVQALKQAQQGEDKDWLLTNYDAKTSEANPNDIEAEADRLLVLGSYGILDSENETEFDLITNEAKDYFKTPIAVVSLVDFGRQWFKSIQGLPVESTPRCVAFCAHVVKRKAKDGVMVVPDATKDDRFKDNPLVAGGPKIRFYAGAALLSPEGARLGSLCVIDYEPHPDFTLKQKEMLESFAAQAVLQMISR